MSTRNHTICKMQRAWLERSIALATALLLSGSCLAQVNTITRVSAFSYNPTTGLLNGETLEPPPGPANDCLQTTYQHDGFGNRTVQTVSNCAGATGSAVFESRDVATDNYGWYTVTLKNAGGADVSVFVPQGTFARTTTNALGHVETRTVDPRFGVPIALEGPNNLTTTWQLDRFGRRERESRADGTYTQLSYCIIGAGLDLSSNSDDCGTLPSAPAPLDAVRFVHSQAKNAANQPIAPFSRTYFDRLDRPIRTVTESFDGEGQNSGVILQDTLYNEFGAKIVETQPYFDSSKSSQATASGAFGRTLTQYDVLGRPTAVYVSDPAPANTVAMPAIPPTLLNNRFPDTGGTAALTTIAYSQLTVTTTNARGQTTASEKDPDGRTLRTTDAHGAQIAYLFDAVGQLVQSLDGVGTEIAAQYDTRGRRTSMLDRNTGQWLYDYNALGELVRQRSPQQTAASQATTFSYDKLGRTLARTTPDYTTTWTYDRYADTSTCTKGVGKLCEVSTSRGVNRKYVHDALGRPTQTTTRLSGAINDNQTRVFTSSVGYDGSGRLEHQTYPTGVRVNVGYTPRGFVSQLTNHANSAMLWRAQRINAWGLVEQQIAGNNVQTRTAYQAYTARVATITAGQGAATDVFNNAYDWDAVGNLASRTDSIGAGSPVSESFVYDSINRLTHYTVNGAAIPGGTRTVGVAYNAAGSLLYKSDVGAYVYPANGLNRPNGVAEVRPLTLGTIEYTYDLNGNVTTTTSTGTQPGYAAKYGQLTYTSFNLPNESQGLAGYAGPTYKWEYDERQARIKEVKSAAGSLDRVTWMLHPDKANGLAFEQEIGMSGIANRHYLMAAGQVVGFLTTAGEHGQPGALTITAAQYWVRDHLGSSGAITDGAGAVTQRFAYDPWGQRRFTDGRNDPTGTLVYDYPAATDRGFTGHEHLDDVGVIHMNGRIYDARIGRFLQTDPFVQMEAGLQAFNRYSYTRNNPLNATDPSGEFIPWPVAIAFSAMLAATAHLEPKFRPYAAIGIGALLGGAGAGISFSVQGAAQAALAGFAAGATATGDVQGGLQGAATMLLFLGAGQLSTYVGSSLSEAGAATLMYADDASGLTMISAGQQFTSNAGIGRAALYAMAGCADAAIAGGDCGRGALTAGITTIAATNRSGESHLAFGTIKYAVAGGTISAVGGGKFANGAMAGAFLYLTKAAPDIYEDVVGYGVDMGPGGDAVTKHILQPPVEGANNVGTQGFALNPDCIFCEGGIVSRAANQIPGINAVAGLHDVMQIRVPPGLMRDITNVPLMPVAALATYSAAFGQLLNSLRSPMYIPRSPRKDSDGRSEYRPPIFIW